MSQYFTEDMVYDTNYFDGTNQLLGNGTGLLSWYQREHIPMNEAFDNQTFNQMIFAADSKFATTTTYAVTPWTKGPFIGVDSPNITVRYRIFDFYRLKNDKIEYNWMVLDAVHLLYQAGYDVLPNNPCPLKQGWVRPPKAMDGFPAPISALVDPSDTALSKVIAREAMKNDLLSTSGKASNYWRDDMIFYGAHGLGVCESLADYQQYFMEKLSQAFTNRSIDLDVLICEGGYCGAHGYLNGIFAGPFLGEEPSNRPTRLRFGLHWHIDSKNRQIIEGYGLLDLPGFFAQSGIDLFKRAHLDGQGNNGIVAIEEVEEVVIYTTL